MLLAIDPGNDTGWALFSAGKLLRCGLTTVEQFTVKAHAECANRAIIETPQIYPNSKAPPNDILKLAVDVGRYIEKCYAAGIVDVETVRPATWKGQIPKDIHHSRLWSKLSPTERDIVGAAGTGMAPSKRNNMLDAVCLGMYAVGRKV